MKRTSGNANIRSLCSTALKQLEGLGLDRATVGLEKEPMAAERVRLFQRLKAQLEELTDSNVSLVVPVARC